MDDELAEILRRVDPPGSRSRALRDLAVRGARAIEEEEAASARALATLLDLADGGGNYDFDAVADLVARRGERLP